MPRLSRGRANPTISRALIDYVGEVLLDQVAGLDGRALDPHELNLASGLAGTAFTLFSLYERLADPRYLEAGSIALRHCHRGHAGLPNAGLWTGVGGVLVVARLEYTLTGSDAMLRSALGAVAGFLATEPSSMASSFDEIDIISGVAGTVIALLGRDETSMALLRFVLARLATKMPSKSSLSVLTFPTAVGPKAGLNLGMAHGLPGIAAALRLAAQYIPTVEEAYREVVEVVREYVNGSDAFPAWVTCDGLRESARVAWCYGAPGAAAGIPELMQWDDARQGISQANVRAMDLGLCHGVMGLSLCASAAGDHDLALALANDAVSRFLRDGPCTLTSDFPSYGRLMDMSLLQGAAGVACALLELDGGTGVSRLLGIR